VNDLPILFSALMVQAIRADRKLQTRRLAERWVENAYGCRWEPSLWQRVKPGDRLWVRETWKPHSTYAGMKPRDIPKTNVFFRADDAYAPSNTPWVPPIHMPRWASRLTLTVTDVRVQKLREITEEDAEAEGVGASGWDPGLPEDQRWRHPVCGAAENFAALWNSIHGPGAWDANPAVVALTFTVAKRNIDA
jgi:hypothetical protein